MEEELVRLLVGGLAVVAGHLDLDAVGDELALHDADAVQDLLDDRHRVGAGALGQRQRDGRAAEDLALGRTGQGRDVRFIEVRDVGHVGHVPDVDRAPVTRGKFEVGDLVRRREGLADRQHDLLACVAQQARGGGAVGVLHLGSELLEGDAVERQPLRIGCDAQRVFRLADQIGETDIVDPGELNLDLAGDAGEVGSRDRRLAGSGRECQRHNGHIVDAAADHQRLGDAHRNAVDVGEDLVADTQDGDVGRHADLEPRGHHDPIVARVGIDVLDLGGPLDDGLQRLGDELQRVLGGEPVGAHVDVDERDGNLRLLLARQARERDEPDGKRGKEQKRRQGRGDEASRQPTRYPERAARRMVITHPRITTRSPAVSPLRTSRHVSPSIRTVRPGTTVRRRVLALGALDADEVEPADLLDRLLGHQEGRAAADRQAHRDPAADEAGVEALDLDVGLHPPALDLWDRA